MVYRRTERSGDATRITEVHSNGEYHSFIVWDDGFVMQGLESTIDAMGWRCVSEFLRHRPGFIKVEEVQSVC